MSYEMRVVLIVSLFVGVLISSLAFAAHMEDQRFRSLLKTRTSISSMG